MNKVAPCSPKSNFFDFTRILAYPDPHDIVYISSMTYTALRFIQVYYFLTLKNWITVDCLLNRIMAFQTIPPLELDVTRFSPLF